jgi:hypothetical protein
MLACGSEFLCRPNLPGEGDNHVVELTVAAGAGTVVRFLNLAGWRARHPVTPPPRNCPALARSRAFALLRRIR